MWHHMVNVVAVTNMLYHLQQLCNNADWLVAYGKTDNILAGHVHVLCTQQQYRHGLAVIYIPSTSLTEICLTVAVCI
jgi:ethanolamine utilization protein EutQ (cupin superfamily)